MVSSQFPSTHRKSSEAILSKGNGKVINLPNVFMGVARKKPYRFLSLNSSSTLCFIVGKISHFFLLSYVMQGFPLVSRSLRSILSQYVDNSFFPSYESCENEALGRWKSHLSPQTLYTTHCSTFYFDISVGICHTLLKSSQGKYSSCLTILGIGLQRIKAGSDEPKHIKLNCRGKVGMQNANPQSEFGQSTRTKTATLANSAVELKHNCGYAG